MSGEHLYGSGTEARVSFSAAIAVMGDAGPVDLGPVANPGIVEIDTFGSNFDTAIAVYSPNGALVEWNDDWGLPQSRVSPDLGAGPYYLLVGGTGSAFGPEFPIEPVVGTPGGQIVGAVAGLPIGPVTLEPEQLRLFRFRVCAPPNAEDLGVVGAPGPIPIDVSATGDDIGNAVLYDSIGRIVASGVPMAPDLGTGRYYLGVGGQGADFREGFRINAPDSLWSESTFSGSVGDLPLMGCC